MERDRSAVLIADDFIPSWDGGLSVGDWTSDEASAEAPARTTSRYFQKTIEKACTGC